MTNSFVLSCRRDFRVFLGVIFQKNGGVTLHPDEYIVKVTGKRGMKLTKEDKQKKRSGNTIDTLIYVLQFVIDGIFQVALFIPRIAIRFIQGLLS